MAPTPEQQQRADAANLRILAAGIANGGTFDSEWPEALRAIADRLFEAADREGADQPRTLRDIVARVNDGWDYVKPAGAGRKGVWFRVQDGAGKWALTPEDHAAGQLPQDVMTVAEQLAIYGEVVVQ